MKVKRYETDLYKPIKDYFTEQGFDVYGEVDQCDVVAVKEKELVIVELKLNLNIDLLMQAAIRQRLTNLVYIAIPKPAYSFRSKKWKDLCYLIKRLELGLIIVVFKKGDELAELMFEPGSFDRVKSMGLSKKKRNRLLSEIEGRSGDFNIGGSHQTRIMSAYKENCIHIACCLVRFGTLSPKALRQMGTGDKTLSILNKNYYDWFDRVERGIYSISEEGKNDLKEHPNLVEYYNEKIGNSM
ncbi:DUF2161 domain-containing phosphodiesterase [Sporosarcina sp. G11-34]|uniref:DUF2161 domain-containing phosphodiesterase n=1 Tax=Sporosarcina sp. G11-34 TaxID=2849605 RepID=UPI0022A96EC8|nr:DUF2161 family putative PD-(D/E)XK-type phosphodiesterase [Sporosarcina sp. G11-34]MCZ2259533.1 hypothetical protein [Sporosarcina sp. G11-34]